MEQDIHIKVSGNEKEPILDEIQIWWNDERRDIQKGQTIEQLLGYHESGPPQDNPVIVAKANEKIVELNYIPQQGEQLYPLDLTTQEGMRAYQRGVLFLMVRAASASISGCSVRIEHSLSGGMYCEIDSQVPISPFDVDTIGRKMRGYVEENQAFQRRMHTREEAIELYKGINQMDKARLLCFRENKNFKTYSCGEMTDYFYGHMPLNTGYLQKFRLIYEPPGFVVLFPQSEAPMAPLTYIPSPKLMHIFRESERWSKILQCTTVADLNEMVDRDELLEFILINEARHDQVAVTFANTVVREGSRVVLIAGPSSSGKTTFTQKLRLQLRVLGKNPIMISLDNYYIDRDKIELSENGEVDLENINTLDLVQFNTDMAALLRGEPVDLPKFDFASGKSLPKSGRHLQLAADDILMIEGIHGLNDMLTESVDRKEKFKIYISALTQLNLDNHNRISTADVRLIRRMVRDYKYRAASAEQTLSMWKSVREGEKKWIFPYQERCDLMFNSTLVYELSFLKKYATPLLEAVGHDSPYWAEANRLNKFLNYFIVPKDETIIPNTSLLREFIGGGIFDR